MISFWNLELRRDSATNILSPDYRYVISAAGLIAVQSQNGAFLCHEKDLLDLGSGAVAGNHDAARLNSCTLLNRQPYATLRFSADGKRMVTIGGDGNVIFRDTATLKILSQFHFGDTFEDYWGTTPSRVPPGAEFNHDLTIMAAYNHQYDSLTLWDISTSPPKLFKIINMPGGEFPSPSYCRFSIDNKMGLTYGSKMSLWQVQNGKDAKIITKFTAPMYKDRELTGTITSIGFSRNGGMLFGNSQDGSTTIWSVDGGLKQIGILNPLDGPYTHFNSDLALSPDGKTLASYTKVQTDLSTYKITLWNLDNLEKIGQIDDC